MAVVVSGAAAGPSDRDVTIDGTNKVLTIYGSPNAEKLTVSGRSSDCCLTIDGSSTFSEFSDDCDYESGSLSRVICDTSKMKGIEAPLGDESDSFEVAGRLPILTVRGETGFDTIRGGKAGETLSGGSDDDKIRGGGGKDDINGGSGRDDCKGSQEARIKKCEHGGAPRRTFTPTVSYNPPVIKAKDLESHNSQENMIITLTKDGKSISFGNTPAPFVIAPGSDPGCENDVTVELPQEGRQEGRCDSQQHER